MSGKQIVTTAMVPKAIGPYSVATRFGDLIFTAGQIGLDPATGELVSGGIAAETRQVLSNLIHVLEAAGSSLENVLKTTVYLRNMLDFAEMNAIYNEFFTKDFPARTTVEAAGLPKNGLIEIEAVACLVN